MPTDIYSIAKRVKLFLPKVPDDVLMELTRHATLYYCRSIPNFNGNAIDEFSVMHFLVMLPKLKTRDPEHAAIYTLISRFDTRVPLPSPRR